MSKDTAYHEIEFKLDAESDESLREVQAWMQNSPKIFTPLHNRVPVVMQGLFQPSFERTRDRTRVYFDTADLDAFQNGVEIRQEAREKGGFKQMIKIDRSGGRKDQMMDRMEYPGVCGKFGVDFEEVNDKLVRRRLMKQFEGLKFKPLIAMISQRTRMKYHPQGDTSVTIEAAFDYPCWGFALNGFVWQAPEMELEIIEGPEDHVGALRLLEREASRFGEFGLKRTATSKPTPGFIELHEYLRTEEGRKAFRNLKIDQEWWMAPDMKVSPVARPDFSRTTSPVARRALAR